MEGEVEHRPLGKPIRQLSLRDSPDPMPLDDALDFIISEYTRGDPSNAEEPDTRALPIDLLHGLAFSEASSIRLDGPSAYALDYVVKKSTPWDFLAFLLVSQTSVGRIIVPADNDDDEKEYIPRNVCHSLSCPIEGVHRKRAYRYKGIPVSPSQQAQLDAAGYPAIWGPPGGGEWQSNPPPWIWAAFWILIGREDPSDNIDIDICEEAVAEFIEAHVAPFRAYDWKLDRMDDFGIY